MTFQGGATTQTWDRNKTFFTFNYGAGLKALRVKGPIGVRGDLRLRTLPAYFGSHKTWMEPTVGVNFVWGER